MRGTAIATLNAWGLSWAGAMQQSLVEGTILLAIVGLVWVLLRRRMSSALASGLFLLVLIKAALPLVLPVTPTVVLPLPVFQPEPGGRGSVRAANNADSLAPPGRFDPAPSHVLRLRRRESRPRAPCPLASIPPPRRRFPCKPA